MPSPKFLHKHCHEAFLKVRDCEICLFCRERYLRRMVCLTAHEIASGDAGHWLPCPVITRETRALYA